MNIVLNRDQVRYQGNDMCVENRHKSCFTAALLLDKQQFESLFEPDRYNSIPLKEFSVSVIHVIESINRSMQIDKMCYMWLGILQFKRCDSCSNKLLGITFDEKRRTKRRFNR